MKWNSYIGKNGEKKKKKKKKKRMVTYLLDLILPSGAFAPPVNGPCRNLHFEPNEQDPVNSQFRHFSTYDDFSIL